MIGNCTAPCVPGQSGPPAEYAPYLEKIVASLLAAPALKSTKLLFAITSPDLCNGVCLSSSSNLFQLRMFVYCETELKD
jgi:hypothetical protein